MFRHIHCPEDVGIDSSRIVEFINEVEKANLDVHGFVLVKNSALVTEAYFKPYMKEEPHMQYAISKGFTSIAVGIAIELGLLNLSDKVLSFFPNVVDNPSNNLQQMTIRNLLTMTSGFSPSSDLSIDIQTNIKVTSDWVSHVLNTVVIYSPGVHFSNNAMNSYLLSVIIQKVTGETLMDFLKPRLFDLLHIENYSWGTCPNGYTLGGWGLELSTRDLAKFGQLILQNGLHGTTQIISESWIKEATSFHIANEYTYDTPDWQNGYGYHFWLCQNNIVRLDGAFGQFLLIMPSQNVVLAINSGLTHLHDLLNIFWRYLFPALKNNNALERNPIALEAFTNKINNLSSFLPKSAPVPNFFTKIGSKKYIDRKNDKLYISTSKDGNDFRMIKEGFFKHNFSIGRYILNNDPITNEVLLAGTYWSSSSTLNMIVRHINSAKTEYLILEFTDCEIIYTHKTSFSFNADEFYNIWREVDAN